MALMGSLLEKRQVRQQAVVICCISAMVVAAFFVTLAQFDTRSQVAARRLGALRFIGQRLRGVDDTVCVVHDVHGLHRAPALLNMCAAAMTRRLF